MIKLKSIIKEIEGGFVYHVTLKVNLPNIKKHGLIPKIPTDFEGEEKAVYLFNSKESAEDAVSNWLGDRFEDRHGEEVKLVLLTISIEGLNLTPTHDVNELPLEWEIKSLTSIPWKNIVKIEPL